MSRGKRSVLLSGDEDGYATLTDAPTDAQSGSEDERRTEPAVGGACKPRHKVRAPVCGPPAPRPKRSVLLGEDAGYGTVTDAPSEASESEASEGEGVSKEAHLAALAWRRHEEQDARLAEAEGAVVDTKPRRGRPRRHEPRWRIERRSERKREPNMWAFFVLMKQIETKGSMHALKIPRKELLAQYKALSGPMQYYWMHMYELWSLYERQQIALWPVLKSKQDGRWRRRKLMLQFYYLSLSEQKKLVDDWIVERTARERDHRAQELEESLAHKTLAKIKADMLAVVSNIDYVLREGRRPHQWQGAFEGI